MRSKWSAEIGVVHPSSSSTSITSTRLPVRRGPPPGFHRGAPCGVVFIDISRARHNRLQITLSIGVAAGERPEHDDAYGWGSEGGRGAADHDGCVLPTPFFSFPAVAPVCRLVQNGFCPNAMNRGTNIVGRVCIESIRAKAADQRSRSAWLARPSATRASRAAQLGGRNPGGAVAI